MFRLNSKTSLWVRVPINIPVIPSKIPQHRLHESESKTTLFARWRIVRVCYVMNKLWNVSNFLMGMVLSYCYFEKILSSKLILNRVGIWMRLLSFLPLFFSFFLFFTPLLFYSQNFVALVTERQWYFDRIYYLNNILEEAHERVPFEFEASLGPG